MTAHRIKEFPKDDEIGRIIKGEFVNEFCEDYILVGEEETSLPIYYEKFADSIKNFEVRDSDIMVCTYPKVGTTWTQEMVWLIANNLDFQGAKTELGIRFPFLELSSLFHVEKMSIALGGNMPEFVNNSVEYSKQQKNPRFIKTHLPYSLLPDDIQNGSKLPKMIYVIRNPKDVCVSYFHHGKLLQGWKTNLENVSKVFMTNKIMYGSFWKHVQGYWGRRTSTNMLIITYEDMKRNLPSVIKKVANFLNKNLTEEQIEQLCKHLSFESMKSNKAVNGEDFINFRRMKNIIVEDGAFIRSGTVGKHKEELSPEIVEKLDVWIKKNTYGTSFGQQHSFNL